MKHQVLSVVENLGDLFDFRNTSTAIHRVAKFSVVASEISRSLWESCLEVAMNPMKTDPLTCGTWVVTDFPTSSGLG